MNTLLVTGSNGWLGSAIFNVFNLYENNLKNLNNIIIHSLVELSSEQRENFNFLINQNPKLNIYFLNGDFKNNKFFEKLKSLLSTLSSENLYVITTVSVIHPTKWDDFISVNVNGLKKFYEVCESFKLAKFTYISSNSPFGFNSKNKIFDENTPYCPIGGYGISKKMAEIFLLNKGVPDIITILRAPWFHGKNMPERQKKFLKSASHGKFPLIGFGNNIRSIVDVGDLAKAIMNVTFKKRNHQIYWVSSEKIKMKEMISIIKKAAEEKGFIKKRSKFNIVLPIGFSSVLFLLDIFLQKLKIYNMYVHVLSEIGQDIFNTNERYKKEFGEYHTFKKIKDTIYEELEEANFKNKLI